MTEVKSEAACMMTKLNLGHSAHQMVLFLVRTVRYNTHRQAGYTGSIGSNHFLSLLLSNQPFLFVIVPKNKGKLSCWRSKFIANTRKSLCVRETAEFKAVGKMTTLCNLIVGGNSSELDMEWAVNANNRRILIWSTVLKLCCARMQLYHIFQWTVVT